MSNTLFYILCYLEITTIQVKMQQPAWNWFSALLPGSPTPHGRRRDRCPGPEPGQPRCGRKAACFLVNQQLIIIDGESGHLGRTLDTPATIPGFCRRAGRALGSRAHGRVFFHWPVGSGGRQSLCQLAAPAHASWVGMTRGRSFTCPNSVFLKCHTSVFRARAF